VGRLPRFRLESLTREHSDNKTNFTGWGPRCSGPGKKKKNKKKTQTSIFVTSLAGQGWAAKKIRRHSTTTAKCFFVFLRRSSAGLRMTAISATGLFRLFDSRNLIMTVPKSWIYIRNVLGGDGPGGIQRDKDTAAQRRLTYCRCAKPFNQEYSRTLKQRPVVGGDSVAGEKRLESQNEFWA